MLKIDKKNGKLIFIINKIDYKFAMKPFNSLSNQRLYSVPNPPRPPSDSDVETQDAVPPTYVETQLRLYIELFPHCEGPTYETRVAWTKDRLNRKNPDYDSHFAFIWPSLTNKEQERILIAEKGAKERYYKRYPFLHPSKHNNLHVIKNMQVSVSVDMGVVEAMSYVPGQDDPENVKM